MLVVSLYHNNTSPIYHIILLELRDIIMGSRAACESSGLELVAMAVNICRESDMETELGADVVVETELGANVVVRTECDVSGELGVTTVMEDVTAEQAEEEEDSTTYVTHGHAVSVTPASVNNHDNLMVEQTWGDILTEDGGFGVSDSSFDEVWAVELGPVARVAHVLHGEASGVASGENLASRTGRGQSDLQEASSETSVLPGGGGRRLDIFRTDNDDKRIYLFLMVLVVIMIMMVITLAYWLFNLKLCP